MRRLRYLRLDVFTDRVLGGNPLAVFPDAEDLDPVTMQRVAREMNLSESTFVLPPGRPDADFRVRIFTPAVELPMAGHPTVGTAVALRRLGRLPGPRACFEEGVGPVPVELGEGEQPVVTMDQPRPEFGADPVDPEAVAAAVSLSRDDLAAELPIQLVSCGVPYLLVPVRDLAAAGLAQPRADRLEGLARKAGSGAALVFTRETTSDAAFHLRVFAPTEGVPEDPATGSAAGPLGAWALRHRVLEPGEGGTLRFACEQGLEMGRPSRIEVEIAGTPGGVAERVRVGGLSVAAGEGELWLDD